ncbi:MAG TPA: serine/threonine-protein kinase [Acidimicrobiia bacterium]|nr:serine/threonine-protein kinase [Acidimicrobiia bacterium]
MLDSNPDFAARLEEVLGEALDLDAEARPDFLDEACDGDPDLRREVEAVLAIRGEAGVYFDGLSAAISASSSLELASAAAPKVEIGPYRTTGVLGSGGMGVVYRARRVDGEFDKQVALKLLHLDMHTPQARARFLAERQILARLEHPGIARLFDGGVTDEGRPYFVMELVEGRPLTDYCRHHQLPLEATLDLFRDAVDAVSYLHRSLVVHRDLKPSNILVDAYGRVKLVDFGIAKLIGEAADADLTLTGQRLLTPSYAAPEQLTGSAITTATDVYGLGMVLYQLLTGRFPHEPGDLPPKTDLRDSTTAPSVALRDAAAPTPIAWRRVAGDLDNICLKALRHEPDRRYASAEQLDADLGRYQQGLPVSARPSTLRYRATRFVQRHRAAVAVAAGVLLLLTGGLVRERTLRNQAQEQTARAEAVSSLLGGLISSADPANARGREVTVAEVVDRAQEALDANPDLADQPQVEAQVRLVLGRTYSALGRLDDARRQFDRAIELGGGIGATDDTTLKAAERLALLLRDSDPERAQAILRRVVARRSESLGPAHDLTLEATASLSRVLRNPAHYAEAESLDREILEQRRATLGPDHARTLRAVNSLAGTLFNTQRYEQAAELYRDALTRSRATLGPDHPDTLRLGGNLAATYSVLGRYGDAEAIQRQVLATRVRVLGENHVDTGLSLHNLGMVLLRQAHYDEAESVFRRAVDARTEGSTGGALYSQSYLADTLRELGRATEAEEVYLQTLKEQKRHFDADFPDIWRTTLGLAELRVQQGDRAEATKLAQQAMDNFRRIYGEEHPQVASCLVLLSRIAMEGRDFDEASRLAERAVAVVTADLPDDHPAVVDARLHRAQVRMAASGH